MTITNAVLPASLRVSILHYCMEKKPHEACGFLLGRIDGATLSVTRFLPVPNIAARPERQFSMDPAVLIPIVTNPSSLYDPVVGLLHSHPSASSAPSVEDLQTAWRSMPSHWIVGLQDEEHCEIGVYCYHHFNHDPNRPGSISGDASSFTAIALSVVEDHDINCHP
ncbi:Mov34/MPN/PAD-1 family protein [Paenibacillus piri]|uniref:MPN domain-containing protein n=1 Tax=Paenibacillus piri TaxID=2547395 RepID=A0A4R5KLT4_9BACL|nr:Mov34/MPN/PAD-1 family protein [Paenibacillus piri]TDF95865.1 hypothetical protein E1757_19260 [Paenibacillus piri]